MNKNMKNIKPIDKYDKRKILSYFYYYCPNNINTFGKMINSCVEAGYNKDYAKNEHRKILDLDRFTDVMAIEWRKIEGLLPLIRKMLDKWLTLYADKPDTPHIRELSKILRIIGDLQGKFIKREEKIIHNIDEKRATLQFISSAEHIKHIGEKIKVLQAQRKEIVDINANNQ